ncbi:MAG: alanine--glyoxylate aminotransferase family protein [Chloroflexi bacterium]|nr:alanine--glyoxylate aminotransferase family protein [Chloroflexota bacterium]
MNLRIPGPTPVPREVAEAGAAEMINHRGPEFAELIQRCIAGAKQVYQTQRDLVILTTSGTGGMEAAVANHVSPGERVLVVTIGVFGKRFVELVQAYGGQPVELAFDFGTAADPNRIDAALATDPELRTVLVTHNETSTGVTNPLAEIARAVKGRDRLLIVDAISSLSSIDVRVDEWDLDVVVSGSQKGWMVAPGLAFVSMSPRAWEVQARCATPRYYFDLRRHQVSAERGQTPWTPAVPLFFQLDAALPMLFAEGMPNVFARHHRHAERVREGVRALGLELFAAEGHRSDTVTAIKVPEGIEGSAITRTARTDFKTVFAGGQGSLTGKIFRFGHLGWVTDADVEAGLDAIERTLAKLGFTAPARA